MPTEATNPSSKFDSVETADHGFQFQLEILFYLCLQLHKMDCRDFSMGFEVNAIEKFDDIVIECEIKGKKFAFFLQAKHMAVKNEIYINNFFAINQKQKETAKKFWKKYNLRQFVESLMTKTVQESLKNYEDCTKRFVIVTNNSVKTDDIETINEDCKEFQQVFKQFAKNEAQILKFGKAFEGEMIEIIRIILVESKKAIIDDYRANPPKPMDFLKNIVVVANLPENLEEICDKFVKKIFSDTHSNLLARFLRENTFNFISVKDYQRNFLTRKVFDEIIEKSKQEVELTGISEAFFQTTQFSLQFKKEILDNVRQLIIEGKKRIIQFERNFKSSILKIYHSLKSTEVKVFLLPLSKISEFSGDFTKLPKSRILIHLDCDKSWRSLLEFENVIVIGEEMNLRDIQREEIMFLEKPLFEELDDKTKNTIFSTNIKIQDHFLELQKIKSIIHKSEDLFVNFMSDLVEELLTKKTVNFGLELPERDKLYVPRDFSYKDYEEISFDGDHLMTLPNVVLQADPGMGKTLEIIELAKKAKEENPHHWVGVYFLNNYTRLFNKVNSKVTKEFAKDFLLRKLIQCESNGNLCRNLIEIYLKEEENIPIFLIFDGFDEIFPTYSDFVMNLIKRLQEMNIRIFITTRTHCMENLKALQHFCQVKMLHFTQDQVKTFIEKFVHLNYPKDAVQRVIENINKNILSDIRLTFSDKLLKTPMLLKMINEAYKKRPEYVKETKNLDVYKLYSDIFEMSFDDYYDKEKTDATSNPIKSGKTLQMKKVTEIYSNLAIAELEMEDLVPPNPFEFNEVEIIGRGFVKKSFEGNFRFVHRTFAEYFLCEAIVWEIVKKNFEIMKYVKMPRFTQISYFTCNSLMDKMQKMNIEFNHKFDLYEIFLFLFFEPSTITLSEFKIVLQYVSMKLSMREMLDFLFLQFNSFNKLTRDHVEYLIEFGEEKYNVKVTNYLLSQLKSKTFSDIIYFNTDFQSLLISRGLQSEDSFERFYMEFVTNYKTSPWLYKKDNLFGVFNHRKPTIFHEMTSIINSEYENSENSPKFKTHDVILINYLTLFDADSCNFIQNILEFFLKGGILLCFLEKLLKIPQRISNNGSTPNKLFNGKKNDCETFITICFEVLKDRHWEEDLYENKTLFYSCWSNQYEYLIQALLKYLSPSTIKTLVSTPKFNGISLIDFYITNEEKEFFPIDYLKHMCENDQIEDIFKLIESNSGTDRPLAMLKIFHIYYNAFLLNKRRTISDNLFEDLANRIINLSMEENNRKILLYPFACNPKYFTNNPSFAQEFSLRLNNHQRFLDNFENYTKFLTLTVKENVKNGNNSLHISSQNNNYNFFKHLQSHLTVEELEKLLSLRNSNGQNYFHSLSIDFDKWEKDKQISQGKLQKLLLTQDNTGKTPFHRVDSKFFYHFVNQLDDKYASVLFIIQDNNKDNILHYLAQEIQGDKKLLREFFQSIGKTFEQTIKAFEKGCSQINSDGKTPGDVGGISMNNLREFIMENLEAMKRDMEARNLL